MANLKFECTITLVLDDAIKYIEHTATIFVNNTYSMNVTWSGTDTTKFKVDMSYEGPVNIKAKENHYHTRIACSMLINGSKDI